MRQQRAALDESFVHESGEAVALHLRPELERVSSLAGYLAVRGEQSVEPAMQFARACGAATTVPVINAHSMIFVRIYDETRFTHNRFGIPEPEITHSNSAESLASSSLELVLVPLVAFDMRGNRLGMGGGFYDRAFANAAERPRLIGVAHDFQRVEALEPMSWDVPLDAVVTASGYQAISTEDQARNKR